MLENRIVSVAFFLSAGNQQVDAIHVTQLERDTVLVCLDRTYNLCSSALTRICTNQLCSVSMYLPHHFYSLFMVFLPRKFKDCESPGQTEVQQEARV